MLFLALKQNCNSILKSDSYIDFENKINILMDFLDSFSGLFVQSGQTIICMTSNKTHLFQTHLIDSSVKTLNNIKYCCLSGSFADANALVRKFRDDLMLFLYILEVLNNREDISEKYIKNDDDICIDAWFDDNVKKLFKSQKEKLCITNYLNYFKKNKSIKKILEEYNLEDNWKNIHRKLNDYTHNNGQSYTRDNIMSDQSANIKKCFDEIIMRLDFMTSLFLILLIMISPSMIQSLDYMDHLECELTPLEGSQYNIAPFVQEFIDEYINKINLDLKVYLKHNNKYGMLID